MTVFLLYGVLLIAVIFCGLSFHNLVLRGRRGHGQAIGAVARHLAEATYCMLKRGEEYREPQPARPRTGKRVPVMS
jgi:hypothetical protein